jgi:hypothetical protein
MSQGSVNREGLARAILSLADSEGLPDTSWQMDRRVDVARRVLGVPEDGRYTHAYLWGGGPVKRPPGQASLNDTALGPSIVRPAASAGRTALLHRRDKLLVPGCRMPTPQARQGELARSSSPPGHPVLRHWCTRPPRTA